MALYFAGYLLCLILYVCGVGLFAPISVVRAKSEGPVRFMERVWGVSDDPEVLKSFSLKQKIRKFRQKSGLFQLGMLGSVYSFILEHIIGYEVSWGRISSGSIPFQFNLFELVWIACVAYGATAVFMRAFWLRVARSDEEFAAVAQAATLREVIPLDRKQKFYFYAGMLVVASILLVLL